MPTLVYIDQDNNDVIQRVKSDFIPSVGDCYLYNAKIKHDTETDYEYGSGTIRERTMVYNKVIEDGVVIKYSLEIHLSVESSE